jgi:hypothetical protein
LIGLLPQAEVSTGSLGTQPQSRSAVPQIGETRMVSLPNDGQTIQFTYRGAVGRFSDLPASPRIGDDYVVNEGPDVSWVWAVPFGWNHGAWVDP